MIRAFAVGLSACLLLAAPAGAQHSVSSYTRNAEADRPGVFGAPVIIAGPGTVLRGSRSVSRLSFSARDAAGDTTYLDVGAAPGDTLQPGVFDGADRMGGTARPALGIGQSCQNEDARFEVRDLALDADGRPTRAWILWETRCYARTVFFGEYRLNQPVGDAPAVSVPGIVRWAAGDPGHPRVDVPVRLTAVRSARVVRVGVEGRDASSFAVGSDACTGRVLAAGESCTVSTRLLPVGSGAKLAGLVVRYADGARQTVPP